MNKIFIVILVFGTYLFAQETAGSFIKEKKEIMVLKQDLNKFYTLKEEEYKKRKQELESLMAKIKSEKQEIQNIYDKNQTILKDIQGEVASKTSKIYNAMKPKIAGQIFNKMIDDGKIEDVFDIILKLKEKKVTQIMRYLSIRNASKLTEKLKNFRVKDESKKG
ncbi:MAG: MotE family protein [Arcobacter sp.]|uniref:MotE family protein n=1 Tax=Arcobacter sp. TaxID=1872629 RepID=UPI003AFF69D8